MSKIIIEITDRGDDYTSRASIPGDLNACQVVAILNKQKDMLMALMQEESLKRILKNCDADNIKMIESLKIEDIMPRRNEPIN